MGKQLLIFLALIALPAVPVVLLAKPEFGHGVATVILLFLTIAFASSAWIQRAKSPLSARPYFMSVPVGRATHSLVRTAAGWSLLMLAGVCVLGFAYLNVDGGSIPLRGWIAPLLGATTFYLVFSGLYAGTRQPYLWLMGLFWLPSLATRFLTAGAETTLEAFATGPFGLAPLFIAAVVREGADGAETIIPIDLQTWLLTSCAWLAAGLAVLLFATMRHRDV